jgi:hypothetical protein
MDLPANEKCDEEVGKNAKKQEDVIEEWMPAEVPIQTKGCGMVAENAPWGKGVRRDVEFQLPVRVPRSKRWWSASARCFSDAGCTCAGLVVYDAAIGTSHCV